MVNRIETLQKLLDLEMRKKNFVDLLEDVEHPDTKSVEAEFIPKGLNESYSSRVTLDPNLLYAYLMNEISNINPHIDRLISKLKEER